MKDFNKILIIDPSLRDFLGNLEEVLSIKIDSGLVEKIFYDSENDQVSKKSYSIYSGKKKLFKPSLSIYGNVEEYEPETIVIEIKNIKTQDYHKLQSSL